jgi:prepilin-type N-terminal cleavage/methylation domain-containing protein
MDSSMTPREGFMQSNLKDEKGMTLVESMIAILILVVGLLATAQVLAFCVIASKTYGRDAGKTTASAHDKMEELVNLQFSDTTTNVTFNSPYPATGVGLTAGGSVYPSAPVAGYADYLNFTGSRTSSGSSAYTRQWQIINDSANVKRIIVSVASKRSYRYGIAPSTTIVTQKTQ